MPYDVQHAPGRVHKNATETERAAARDAIRLGSQRWQVYEALRKAEHGLTDDEGAQLFGWFDRLKFGRRRQELCMAGLVHDSGRRRDTPLGHQATVWELVRDDAAETA